MGYKLEEKTRSQNCKIRCNLGYRNDISERNQHKDIVGEKMRK